MINRTLNVQSLISVENQDIGFLSCQIDCNVKSLNLSIQITNNELCEKHKEEVQRMCSEFMRASFDEAAKVGWDMLKVEF